MTHPSTSAPVPRAYSSVQRRRIILIAGVLPAVFAFIGAGLMLSFASELPNPIAIHFDASGAVDGYGSLGGMVAMLVGLVMLFSTIIVVSMSTLRASPQQSWHPRFMVAASVWLSAVLTVGITGTVWAQRGLADAAETGSVVGPFLAGVGIGFALGAGAWFLTPMPALLDEEFDGTQPAMDLAAQERASWSRSSRPAPATVVLFLVIFGAVALASTLSMALSTAEWTWSVVALLVFVLIASVVCFFWRVSVDHHGVTVRSGMGFPKITIPLNTISGARVVQVNPFMDFGGWGWRWAGGRSGIVVRAGEALEITRTSGKVLVVTVDDAATAVALLEGLLRRGGPSVPQAFA
jgi:hypothetical protein